MNETWKIGDIVVFDYFQRSGRSAVPKYGEIVYMSKVDNTVNVKCFNTGFIVNVGKEILRLNSLPHNTKSNGDVFC